MPWRFVFLDGSWIVGDVVFGGRIETGSEDDDLVYLVESDTTEWAELKDGRLVNLALVKYIEEVRPREGSVSEGAREG